MTPLSDQISTLPQDPLAAGLELMLAGMGTVFLFLTLLVLATRAMSALVQRLPGAPTPVAAQSVEGDPTNEELAAIAAAIHQHRSRSQ